MSNSHETLAARMTDGITTCTLESDDHHNAVDVVIRQNGTMTIRQTFYGASEVVALSADGVRRLVETVTAHSNQATMLSLDGAARDRLYLDTLAWCFQYAPDGREEQLLEKAHARACRRLGLDATLHFSEWSARTFASSTGL